MLSASIRFPTLAVAILALICACQSTVPKQREPATAPVVFVCEHGNVKSLIAASLFDQVAIERGLPFRAVSRGLSPESGVPPTIADSLRSDGVSIEGFTAKALSAGDVENASRVIAIGVDLTPFLRDGRAPTELWSDVPPASVDYQASRAALLRHIDALLDELEAKR